MAYRIPTDMKNSIVNLHCLIRIKIIISTVSNFKHWYIYVLSTRQVSKARKISKTIKYSTFWIILCFFHLWIICLSRVLSTKLVKRNNIIIAFVHCKSDYIISQIDGALYIYRYIVRLNVLHMCSLIYSIISKSLGDATAISL